MLLLSLYEGSFLVNKNTIEDYLNNQLILSKKDVTDSPYETSYILNLVRNNVYREILDKYKSVAFRGLLKGFVLNPSRNMSILESASFMTASYSQSYKKVLENVDYILINKLGGYTPVNLETLDKNLITTFDYINSNIIKSVNKNLVLENANQISEEFKKLIPDNSSFVFNFSNLVHTKELDEFIRSSKWDLWVETQGMSSDVTMYINFLDKYGEYINTINVKTSAVSLVKSLENKYTDIKFIRLNIKKSK